MPREKTTRSLRAADALVLAIVVVAFAYEFGLRQWGAWYSGDWIFRAQTDALLSGRLALLTTPHLQRYDWAWGVGSQQIWGLGIPLLRLPLEVLAHVVGAYGFPDTLTFILYFALVATALARAFHAPAGASVARATWERAAPLVVVALCPAFVTLCRTRFEVYEEAIAGAFLWVALVGTLLFSLVEEPRARTLALLCAASGVAVLFRPPAIFYGSVAAALGLYAGWRARLGGRALAASAALFCAGVVAQLILNQVRFQNPLEFGQMLNISYNTTDQLTKNFGVPFDHEPLYRAAPELLSVIFRSTRPNGYWFYLPNLIPWQSPTLRFREFYFATFRAWMALPVLGGWLGALGVFLLRRRSATARALLADRRIAYGALFSFGSFVLQARFYLHTPAIASRYVVDFAIALSFAMATLLLIAFSLVRAKLDGWRGAAASAAIAAVSVALVAHAIHFAWIGQTQSHRRLLTAEQVDKEIFRQPAITPPVPDHYRCGQSPQASGITMNGVGWAATSSCAVTSASPFFLPSSECITVHLAPKVGQATLDPELTRVVRARRGILPMIRVRDAAVEDGRLLTFCGSPKATPNPTGIELISMGWVDPLKTSPAETPFRLIEIANTRR